MKIRDRIKELRRVAAGELKPNPRNWRQHPEAQEAALRGVLGEIGYADALLARELPDGTLELIDGHLRAGLDPAQKVPVLILDLDEAEATKLLAVHDPLAAMAEVDEEAMGKLLAEIATESEGLQAMLDELADKPQFDPAPPSLPVMRVGTGLADMGPSDEDLAILRGRRILLEYSGGKDSSAVALWCRHWLPDNEMKLLFVDMGADFTGLVPYLHEFAAWLGVALEILPASDNIIDLFLKKKAWPHFRHPYCHDLLIATMRRRLAREDADAVVICRGGRMTEKISGTKSTTDRWLSVGRMPGFRCYQPMYFTAKNTVEDVLATNAAPLWKGYGRGLCRTACRCCPGQRPRAYAAIRREYPEVWAELPSLESSLGSGCWSGITKGTHQTFDELATRGEGHLLLDGMNPDAVAGEA